MFNFRYVYLLACSVCNFCQYFYAFVCIIYIYNVLFSRILNIKMNFCWVIHLVPLHKEISVDKPV